MAEIASMKERYRTFHQDIKKVFGGRVDRITLNAGLNCPNIDGTKSFDGCIFCQNISYLGASFSEGLSLKQQITCSMAYVRKRHRSTGFFAYFQNGTNTYAPANVLRRLYDEVLSFSEIVGLFIATRPDCLDADILKLLEEYNKKTYLWVELGIPSHRDDRNERLNRSHTVSDFKKAVNNLHQRNIKTCAQTILGLSGETEEEIVEKSEFFNEVPINGIKIHNLVVFKDTKLEREYREEKYKPLTLKKYASWCVDFLEHLRPDIVVQRLNAHGPRNITVAPDWSINKMATVNAVHDELERRDTWQGKKWMGSPQQIFD